MEETKTWEYRVESIGGVLSGPKDDVLERILDEWGEEGWEVISADVPYGSSKVRIIAKRPLTPEIRRRRSRPG